MHTLVGVCVLANLVSLRGLRAELLPQHHAGPSGDSELGESLGDSDRHHP